MGQPRQREHQTLKSHINLIRESFVLICSLALWLYSSLVIYTFVTVIFSMPTYINQTVLTVLKINFIDILNVFTVIGLIILVTVFYLVINYQFNKYEVNKNG